MIQNRVNLEKNTILVRIILCIFLSLSLVSSRFIPDLKEKTTPIEININWTDSLVGDFSFTNNWDYPEGVYMNTFGQLSCDGICPIEIENMKAENGQIYKDSLPAFYQLVDTSHLHHTIACDAWCYEWAGTNYVTANKKKDTIICATLCNAGTHCSLKLTITKNTCLPIIELNSVANNSGHSIYTCNTGKIELDRTLWNKGILKATFSFTFNHQENPSKPMFWKGKIVTKIHENN